MDARLCGHDTCYESRPETNDALKSYGISALIYPGRAKAALWTSGV